MYVQVLIRDELFLANDKRKRLSYVKYPSKRSAFLRLKLYLCHVIDDFLFILNCSTMVSEKSDMAKS